MKRSLFVLTLILLISKSFLSQADTIRNITVYAGPITNKLTNEATGREIEDEDLLKGIYYQQIDPDKYQWNVFLYNSDDINHSDLLGAHIIADWYLKKTKLLM